MTASTASYEVTADASGTAVGGSAGGIGQTLVLRPRA
jgi:hypothetical protein